MAVQKLFDSDLMDSFDGVTKRFRRLWKVTVANPITDRPENDPGLPAIGMKFDDANPTCLLNAYESPTRQGPYEYTISAIYATDDFGKTWTFPPTTDAQTRPWSMRGVIDYRKIPSFSKRFSTFRDGATIASLTEWVRDDLNVMFHKCVVTRKVSVPSFGPTEIAQIKAQAGKFHVIGTIGTGQFADYDINQTAKNNVEITYTWIVEIGCGVPNITGAAATNRIVPAPCPEGKQYVPRPANTGVNGSDRDSSGNQIAPVIDIVDSFKTADVVTNPSLPGNPTTP